MTMKDASSRPRPRAGSAAALAAGALATLCLAAVPARAAAPDETRFGFRAEASAHAGLGYAWSEPRGGDASYGAGQRRSRWTDQTAAQALLSAHAYRLIARVGFASGLLQDLPDRSGTARTRRQYFAFETGEASLRLRFGPADADDGILIGRAPLQGDPDAVLFGNYLARYHAYPAYVERGMHGWDSLGTLAPRVTGVRLALGRADGPARFEGWLRNEDGNAFSLIGFLSGRAARKAEWGLGVQAYRAFARRAGEVQDPGKECLAPCDTLGGAVVGTGSPDTAYYEIVRVPILVSARASADFASLFDPNAPPGRYGGLFAEAAVLGWEDQAPFFADRARRIAWTLGARLPSFGWLDVCTLQWEWRPRPDNPFTLHWVGVGSWVPAAQESSAPRRPPWSLGILLAKRFGPHVEGQIRALHGEEATLGASFDGPSGSVILGRETEILARIAFRFR